MVMQHINDKMSRQPPLPPGLPPKLNTTGSWGGDSYRPQNNDNYYSHNAPPMYQFRGGYDSKPSYDPQRPAPRFQPVDHAPGTLLPHGPSGDSYRPQEGGFSFRYDAPPTLDFRQADTYRPRSAPRQRNYGQENNNNFRQNNHADNQRNIHGGYGYRSRAGPRMASDRLFLKGNRAPTPELMPGMDEDDGHGVRFKPIEDVSDSDEAEMDLSDDENDDAQHPKKKQARTETKAADGDSVPRWSNPDPYTALPPPDETQRKKKDVVKLIRKARVAASSENASKTEADADDFISFDLGVQSDDLEDDDFTSADHQGNGVPGAPTGPRSDNRYNAENQDTHFTPKVHVQDAKARQGTAPNHGKNSPQVIDLTADPALGNRKRNIDDEIKGPPLIHSSAKGKKPAASGRVLKEWEAKAKVTSTPWVDIDHSDTANMGLWLHKEIMDFYHHVKPRDFEQFVRTKLVEDLRARIKRNFSKNADIHTFGSFPAGLYLPTADMDLVCVSDEYMKGSQPLFGTKSALHRFSAFLERQNLALPGSRELILNAKVPLVKYVDKLTGLKVDISFENDTGLTANKTFQDWKSQFPAMPILVTLIKHLLAMRGLNEPVNGGIGGFSVTCLVVSLLQNIPQVQSRSMIPEHHLGEILMEFLDLYGNQFNVQTTAIQFDPPGYVSKAQLGKSGVPYKQGSMYKLSIIDPNNPYNDIAGGSSNTGTILKCFSDCYNELQKRMSQLQDSADRRNRSILCRIVGGNYESFRLQREHLAHVHEKLYGPVNSS